MERRKLWQMMGLKSPRAAWPFYAFWAFVLLACAAICWLASLFPAEKPLI